MNVDGLYHIVVGAGLKAHLLIENITFGGDDQHRQVDVCVPQLAYKRKTIHAWHHDICNNQINGLIVQNIQRFRGISRREGMKIIFF